MDISEVIAAVEAVAPLSGAASWDKSGLQVASHRREVKRLAVALDPIPATVRTALEQGADMVLT
ncbi:MAG: Nif3-like dinuclear metal center hexameric protein, partial [Desulfovibrionaceae bacterium]|nr:Nif3-like dinuclear metal center hexameric protein [Desulfovibrionaceae bacterium]